MTIYSIPCTGKSLRRRNDFNNKIRVGIQFVYHVNSVYHVVSVYNTYFYRDKVGITSRNVNDKVNVVFHRMCKKEIHREIQRVILCYSYVTFIGA